MDDKVIFTEELTDRLIKLRFANDQLFNLWKQPWVKFHKLLMEDGFPSEITTSHVRKRWSYLYDSYRAAKKAGRLKKFKYYKQFEKHLGKKAVLDKYESWSNVWRLQLATCILETKKRADKQTTLWRTVENAMRSQDLPEDCCVQDMRGLWHYLKVQFRKHHRKMLKDSMKESDWPLYDVMLEYGKAYEPELMLDLDCTIAAFNVQNKETNERIPGTQIQKTEFQWTKDITESFIQLRLQNEHLFRENRHGWQKFVKLLWKEHGFPTTLKSHDACKKWSSINSDFQKAKATNNRSWLYYALFEWYLAEDFFSLDPLADWQEKWVLNLIEARAKYDHLFVRGYRNPSKCWREVEKELRRNGIPLDHSLLELPTLWSHLVKTYKWKIKFANKGVLKEQWPYLEAMMKCDQIINRPRLKPEDVRTRRKKIKSNTDFVDFGAYDHDDEDDLKLNDLKKKMQKELKPNCELKLKQCRACADVGACIDIFQCKDEDGVDVASKLSIICGLEVQNSQFIPTQICNNCLEELENAYKFRRKVQMANAQFQDYSSNIKIEIVDCQDVNNVGFEDDNMDECHLDDIGKIEQEKPDQNIKNVESNNITNAAKKERKKYKKYLYHKVCDICGLRTPNLQSHMDSHNKIKSYTCEVCGKSFKFKTSMKTHRLTHNPDYSPKTVTCEICGKKFVAMAHYKRHMGYHKNERKYACDTCDKRFNDPGILKVHKLIHSDERPFQCSDCGKSFRTKGCVARHKRIVHKVIRNNKE